MKYVVVLSDGMAGRPLSELEGKTTMEAAVTPVMDRLSAVSEIGMVSMIPKGMAPGSDTANLAVLGYNPQVYYTGRSPLEALSIGVTMKESDVSFRCNLVTLSEEDVPYEERTMVDHSSGEISTEDAAILLQALKEGLEEAGYHFYAGTSYRHLLIWEEGHISELTPPHDILTRKISQYLPEDQKLRDMMKKSWDILENHPINVKRREKGLRPANSAWFWGAGKRPHLTSFEERTGKKGVMISAVDLLKGIAVGAGMESLYVEGANGGLDTNYIGKAQAAVEALLHGGFDFAYIHVEAPDEMAHQGSARDKITAIERVDEKVLATVVRQMEKAGEEYRLLLLPDHPTPVEARTHTGDPVPYLLYDSRLSKEGCASYCERSAAETSCNWPEGYRLIEHLLEKTQS